MAPTKSDHYKTLSVERTASADEIRRAYLSAARKWHPDRHSDASPEASTKAEQAMRSVNEAWRVLGNATAKSDYDRRLFGSASSGEGSSGTRFANGVTRIDPRLLDRDVLAARRHGQIDEISTRSSMAMRAAPVFVIVTMLLGIFVFSAYAREDSGPPSESTVPGPSLGSGIEAFDCVTVIGGPSLLELPSCTPGVEQVIAASLTGQCPVGSDRTLLLTNGVTACLRIVQ